MIWIGYMRISVADGVQISHFTC